MGTKIGDGYVGVALNTRTLEGQMVSLGTLLGSRFGKVGTLLGSKLGSSMGKGVEDSLGGAAGHAGGLIGLLSDTGPYGMAIAGASTVTLGLVAGLGKLGDSFNNAYQSIARQTGLTGQKLQTVKKAFNDVLAATPASMQEVADTVSEIQRYTSPASKNLAVLSRQYITLSKITDTPVAENVEAGMHALEQWAIEGDKAPKALNAMFTASRKTGVGFSELADQVRSFAPQLKVMGYGWNDSLALLANFDKQGANTGRLMSSLSIAASHFAKQQTNSDRGVEKAHDKVVAAELKLVSATGKQRPKALAKLHDSELIYMADARASAKLNQETVPQAFERTVAAIKHAKTETDALQIATSVFGSRGAVQMTQEIRASKFDFANLGKELGHSGNAIGNTAERTKTLGYEFGILKNSTKVALQPLASATFNQIKRGLMDVMTALVPVTQYIGKNMPRYMNDAKPVLAYFGRSFQQTARFINDAWNVMKPIFYALGDVIQVVSSLLTGKWANAWDAFKRLGTNLGHTLEATVKSVFDLVTAPFTEISRKWDDAIHNFWGKLTKFPGQVASKLAGLGVAVYHAFLTGFTKAGQGAQAGINAFWGWVKKVPGMVGRFLGGLASDVYHAFLSGFTAAGRGAQAGINAFWGWVKNIAVTVARDLANLGKSVLNAAQSGFSTFVQGAKDGINTLWGWISGLPARVVRGFGNIGTWLYQAGKDLIKGFVNGITAVPNIIENKLLGLLPGPLKRFAGALGLGSPSRLFRQFGIDTVQGYVNGLASMAPVVNQALVSLAPTHLPLATATNAVTALNSAASLGSGSPAVYIANATFVDEADIETLLRKTAFAVSGGRL
jgi:phage-related minor tail protein